MPASPTRSSARSSAICRRCRAPRSRARAGGDNGAIIVVADWDEAVPLIDRIAPEHLELAVEDPDAIARRGAPCRRDLPRPAHARGDRRLCRRPQPRAADRAQRAVRLRARRARFHEAHHAGRLRSARASPRSPRRRSGSPKPRGSTRTRCRWRCAWAGRDAADSTIRQRGSPRSRSTSTPCWRAAPTSRTSAPPRSPIC